MNEFYFEPDGRKYKKERFTISTPRYTYVRGKFVGKFNSDKIENKNDKEREEFFKFKIYEGEIEVLESSKTEFKKSEDSKKAIKVHLSQMPEKIKFFQQKNGEKLYYDFDISQPFFHNFSFVKELQQNEDKEAFGTITADFYGHLIDFTHVETYKKRYALLNLKRKKETVVEPPIFDQPIIDPPVINPPIVKQPAYSPCAIQLFASIAGFFLSLVFGFVFGSIISALFLLYVLFKCYFKVLKYLFYFLGILFLLGFIFSLFQRNWGFSPKPYLPKFVKQTNKPTLRKKIFLLSDINEKPDFFIEQEFRWKSYKNELYAGKYGIKNSELINSRNFKNSLPEQISYNTIIFQLKESDKNSLEQVYKMFDKLKTERNLDQKAFAEMVVSFVQNIPYTLILRGSCNGKDYTEDYIKKYLQNNNAPCSAFQKFGINTPVEFLSNLNGDCDTRTLLLFTILEHYKYEVILLSSDVYQHSILGVNLAYNGKSIDFLNKKYMLWETTSFSPPGKISNEISNTNNWYVSLKSKSL
jgi:hypothetical protein